MSMAYTYNTGGTTSGAWTTWNYSSTGNYSTDNTWYTWTTGTTTTSATDSSNYVWYTWTNGAYQPVETKKKTAAEVEAERVAAQKAAEAATKEYEAEKKKREEAILKAQQLLVSLLDEKQIKDLEKKGSFGFIAKSGALFIIEKGRAGNVKMVKDKKETRLCCHPRKNVPDYDTMAAQLLMLKYAEDEFVGMANKTPLI